MSESVIVHTHCQHPKNRMAAISAKCSDLCAVEVNGREHDGYVPSDMGIGGGDYVEFRWCLDCGAIGGTWPKHTDLEKEEECDCRLEGCGHNGDGDSEQCGCACHGEE